MNLLSIETVLMKYWDPIGVNNEPRAHDEYDIYAKTLFNLIREGASAQMLSDKLIEIERNMLGLPGNLERANAVAIMLLK